MDEKISIEALIQVKEIFDKANFEYWLDSGTLLGAVRDGKMISWDSDIDLGTWYSNIDKVLSTQKNLQKKGFLVLLSDQKDHISILKKDCCISLMLYQLKNGKATHTWFVHDKLIGQFLDYLIWILKLRDPECKKSRIPLHISKQLIEPARLLPIGLRACLISIFQYVYKRIGCRFIVIEIDSLFFSKFSTIKFYGTNFKIPQQTSKYLSFRYGKDWRTPKQNWVYYNDDGSVIQNK